ncbi:hypothetical protein FPANT_14102 [Fusarium pseudoanthophilum]|uniref:Actin-like ATPase domain-containing protein n=1 Tax=Fusarium pseudoanthophilum TaxID=48495 RepID=A0A8H5NIX4_9HYPO|nr:hypothetical protein FPANT_14102 [Fusarium pseudoanthophilum]
MDSSSGSRTRVVAAIDFGTTFSGISYALLTGNEAKCFYWKFNGGHSPKTPTRIEFNETPIEWFKLSLLHRDDLPSDVRNSGKFKELTEAREAINVTAVNATARYLDKIWRVFCKKLQSDIPDAEIQISVTVPVLWPLYARQAMEEALNRAGILNERVVLAPKFLIEPEAAALAFFSNAHYFDTNISKLKIGDTVMVCDCGGGTVDNAAYTITSIHPFRVEELLTGQCIFAGACLLDDGFMGLLKEKVEALISPQAFQALTKKDLHYVTSRIWESFIKRRFQEDFPTQKIYLPIKWAASRQRRMPIGQGDDVTFTNADIASIFDPIVGKITHLIEKEMLAISAKNSEDVSYLVVSGGFGQNTYLRQKVAETVARVSPTTNILDYHNMNGWNAVSMGAVTKALQAQKIQQQVLVTSRIVRADWGVRAAHGDSIIRLVKENESLDATRPNRRNIPAEALSAEYHPGRDGFTIRVCRADQRKNESKAYRNVCRINWKTVDVGLKPDMNADLKAPLEIDFIWDGAEMEFTLFYDGVLQSSVEIEHYWNV